MATPGAAENNYDALYASHTSGDEEEGHTGKSIGRPFMHLINEEESSHSGTGCWQAALHDCTV